MLKVERRDDGTYPVFACDVCMAPIRDFKMAAVVFPRLTASSGQSAPAYVVHKGTCHDLAECVFGEGRYHIAPWTELTTAMDDLLNDAVINRGAKSA